METLSRKRKKKPVKPKQIKERTCADIISIGNYQFIQLLTLDIHIDTIMDNINLYWVVCLNSPIGGGVVQLYLEH